ncbi:MAG: hypothetical protein ACI3Y4_03920 [Candidatus Cryptobacteroides sp.]
MFQDFPNGVLWLSQEALPAVQTQMSLTGKPLNDILSVVFLFVVICDIKDFFIIWRPLAPALARWKPLLALEYNMQLARTRNRLAGLLFVPFCLVADWAGLTPLTLLQFAAAMAVAGLLKWALSRILSHKRVSQDNWNAAVHACFTLFIVLSVISVLSAGIMGAFGVYENVARIVLYVETGLFYLLSLTREAQILNSNCGPLRSFLYLCALELPPAAVLASAILLFG